MCGQLEDKNNTRDCCCEDPTFGEFR